MKISTKLNQKKKLTKKELAELEAKLYAEAMIESPASQDIITNTALAPHYAEVATLVVATDAMVASTATVVATTAVAATGAGIGMGTIGLGVLALGGVAAAAGGGGGGGGGSTAPTPTDTIMPIATITIGNTAIMVGGTTTVTIIFSEKVTGVEISDFIAQNGILSNLSTTDNITYTALYTPNIEINDATNVITLVANSYKDIANNDGNSATSDNYTVNTLSDIVAPTTTLSNNTIMETVVDTGLIYRVDMDRQFYGKISELTSDENNVTYSMVDNPNFELKTTDGVTSIHIKNKSETASYKEIELDYESGITSYDIDITTTDASNNARTQTFTINITDYTGNYTGTINDDYIFGTSEVDTLNGSDGNDDFYGDNGNDTINGGNGSDTYHYDDIFSITADAVIDLSTGVVTDRYGSVDTLISIENIFGSSFSDTITGDAGNNILNGWLGNDTINGGDGDDTIIGGDGAWYNYMTDEKLGGDSTDVMTGGNDSDTFKYISESHGYFMYDADLKLENIDTITDFTTNLDGVFDAGEDILDLREFLYQDKTTSGYYVQTEYRANIEGFFGVQEGTGNIWIDRDGGDSNGFYGVYVVNITGQNFTTDDFINLINAGQILV